MEFVVLLLLSGFFLFCWAIVVFVKALSKPKGEDSPNSSQDSVTGDLDGTNEGYYHDGPEGYSAMTSYPQTQYGSRFDDYEQWHEDHSRKGWSEQTIGW